MEDNSPTPVSQSMNPHIEYLNSQVIDLQEQLEMVNNIVKYLATANAELSRDMQMIYHSLEEVASSMKHDPTDNLFNSLLNKPDDDLPN